ncbi:MAG: metal ABC transporter substrate-binding protein [Calditrichia bacterium]
MKNYRLIYFIILLPALVATLFAGDKIMVVTTLTTYADIAREIGGDKVEVEAIVEGDQDAHFVKPKPSYAVLLSRADLFVETGLDLELWAPTLIDKSGNPGIRSGQAGYVAAADGVKMLEVPATMDRSEGDVHIYGNPHITTGPLNIKIIASNIAAGLSNVSPENAGFFRDRLKQYNEQIDTRLFGEPLVRILGSETLTQLAQSQQLMPFLESQTFQGQPLVNYLGGWLKEMLPLRGKRLVAYHKNWIYFATLFGLNIIGYVEPKPGIPPSPRHVEQLIQRIRQDNVKVILAANYFDERKVREIAEKIKGTAVVVPLSVDGVPEVRNYFQLMDYWTSHLLKAFQESEKGA